jgi:hypothetical protein
VVGSKVVRCEGASWRALTQAEVAVGRLYLWEVKGGGGGGWGLQNAMAEGGLGQHCSIGAHPGGRAVDIPRGSFGQSRD